MVDGDDLVGATDELGVEGALDRLLHQAIPGAACKLAGLPVDRLAVALADLKHERPVGTRLLLAVWGLGTITLQVAALSVPAHVNLDISSTPTTLGYHVLLLT